MPVWQTIGLLAFAGAAGTIARWGTAEAARAIFGNDFPWGILVVNVIGCFVFGLIYTLTFEQHALHRAARLVILTGFLGAYTTFSTFAFDTTQAIERGRWDVALANLVLQNALGIAAVFAGFAAGRWWNA